MIDVMFIATMSLVAAITSAVIGIFYWLTLRTVKEEVNKAITETLPEQLQALRTQLDGDLKVVVGLKKDGEAKIEEVVEDN